MYSTSPPTPITPVKKKPKVLVWLKRHWISVAIISVAFLAAGGFMLAALSIQPEKIEVIRNKSTQKPKEKFYSPLTATSTRSSTPARTGAPLTATPHTMSTPAVPSSTS